MAQREDGGGLGAAAGSVSSSLSGTATDVVQARDVRGGIHFHAPAGPGAVVPRQLPADVRGFVGRERELALRTAAMDPAGPGGGVVVLAGTAGVGKSALAVRFAHLVRERFDGGALFVNLHGYDAVRPAEPGGVLERFLRALGMEAGQVPVGLEERAEAYRSLLAERRALVVLDNAATAGQVRPLLPGAPGCLVLVTSRGRLSALAAREGAHRIGVGLLPARDAVALITQTTGGQRGADAPAQVAQLARLCARLPLALRIAAERAAARPLMPLERLLAQLRGESSVWQALSVEEESQADAVRTVFSWSYRALPAVAARAFRLLGVHPGPHLSVGCAAALLAEPRERAEGLLDVLAGAHLIEQTGPDRYQFHDLLRSYAADQARQVDDQAVRTGALARAACWYLYTAHDAGRRLDSDYVGVVDLAGDPAIAPEPVADRAQAVAWYRAEQENFAPIAHAAAAAGLDRQVWQLAVSLELLHADAGTLDDWRQIALLGVHAARRVGDRVGQAHAQLTFATASFLTGRTDQAIEALTEARAVFAADGDKAREMDAVNRLGLVHYADRRLERAEDCFHQLLALAQDAGLPVWRAQALANLADTLEFAGHWARAATYAAQALADFEQSGADAHRRVGSLLILARAERAADQPARAAHFAARATAALPAAGTNPQLEYAVGFERSTQALKTGHADQALEGFWRCAHLARTLGRHDREAQTLTAIGNTLLALGRYEEAADFARTAADLSREHATAFDTAHALATLAAALTTVGAHTDAEDARTQAVTLLQAYQDPAAQALHRALLQPSTS